MDTNIYLSSEQLDTLTNRVCRKINFLKEMGRGDMWEKPMEYCRQIEQSVMAVDTVVLKVREIRGHYCNSSAYPMNYQMMAVRIYILLYYRHHDDALYAAVVYPALREHMGVFGDDKYLNDIHSKMNEVRQMEELISKARQRSRIEKRVMDYLEGRKQAIDTKDTFTSADIVRLQQRFEQQTDDLNRQLKEKDERIAELERQVAEADEAEEADAGGEEDEALSAQKVRLDLLLRLMEKDGADLEKHGNKTKAAEIMREVTGLALSTCKNYCTNKDLNTKEHEETILKLNSKLQALGLSVRL